MARYFSRMGGGSPISVTKDEIMEFVKNPPKSTRRKGGYKKGGGKDKYKPTK